MIKRGFFRGTKGALGLWQPTTSGKAPENEHFPNLGVRSEFVACCLKILGVPAKTKAPSHVCEGAAHFLYCILDLASEKYLFWALFISVTLVF